ncbi:MAG TPA: ribbon-helix-helix protein, CopG family [Geminicoccaceae bacterium]|nr:ribbon-helix-helix protein, CopG family [Geminicoccaceae bacterium]
MVRTQVYFSEEQHRALRRAARREGISMTAFLRRMVERELVGRATKPDYSKDAIMAFVGLGSAEPADTSERHDEALDEAFRG